MKNEIISASAIIIILTLCNISIVSAATAVFYLSDDGSLIEKAVSEFSAPPLRHTPSSLSAVLYDLDGNPAEEAYLIPRAHDSKGSLKHTIYIDTDSYSSVSFFDIYGEPAGFYPLRSELSRHNGILHATSSPTVRFTRIDEPFKITLKIINPEIQDHEIDIDPGAISGMHMSLGPIKQEFPITIPKESVSEIGLSINQNLHYEEASLVFSLEGLLVSQGSDDQEKKIVPIDPIILKEEIDCIFDGSCSIDEHHQACPGIPDCPRSGNDNYCEDIEDGICDSDCPSGSDQNDCASPAIKLERSMMRYVTDVISVSYVITNYEESSQKARLTDGLSPLFQNAPIDEAISIGPKKSITINKKIDLLEGTEAGDYPISPATLDIGPGIKSVRSSGSKVIVMPLKPADNTYEDAELDDHRLSGERGLNAWDTIVIFFRMLFERLFLG